MSKELFKCGYCGKEHERVIDRAECEIKCDMTTMLKLEQERQKKLGQERQKKLQSDENERLKVIQNTYDLFVKQMMDFKSDYRKVIRLESNSNNVYPSLLDIFDLLRF